MVDVEAGTLTMFCNEAKGTRVLVSATEMIRLSCAFVVIRGWPGRERFFDECRILRRVRKLDTICRGNVQVATNFCVCHISTPALYPAFIPFTQFLSWLRSHGAKIETVVDNFNLAEDLW